VLIASNQAIFTNFFVYVVSRGLKKPPNKVNPHWDFEWFTKQLPSPLPDRSKGMENASPPVFTVT